MQATCEKPAGAEGREAPVTESESSFLALCGPDETVTIKPADEIEDGMPEITPESESDSPGGSVPSAREKR